MENEKICAWCEDIFRTAAKNRRYCGRECAKVANMIMVKQRAEKLKEARGEKPVINCRVCKESFNQGHGSRLYCSAECAKKANKLQTKESAERIKEARGVLDIMRQGREEARDKKKKEENGVLLKAASEYRERTKGLLIKRSRMDMRE